MSEPARRRAVVTFALPDEGSAFTRRLKNPRRDRAHLAPITGELGEWTVTAAFTGVGAAAECRVRLEAALGSPDDRPELVISSGFAGALQSGIGVGDLVLGENFSDPALTENAARVCARGSGLRRGALTTQPAVAETAAAKTALGAATGALAVDMETAWIAEACVRAGLPMLSLRVISDAADQPFPAPGAILFDVARQRPRYVRLPLWLATHPWRVAPFVRFVRGLAPARAALADAICMTLAAVAQP